MTSRMAVSQGRHSPVTHKVRFSLRTKTDGSSQHQQPDAAGPSAGAGTQRRHNPSRTAGRAPARPAPPPAPGFSRGDTAKARAALGERGVPPAGTVCRSRGDTRMEGRNKRRHQTAGQAQRARKGLFRAVRVIFFTFEVKKKQY